MGHQKPQEYYKRSAICCLTSTREGLPMSLLEAESYGCALLAFDSFSAIYDIIEDNVNGYIIPAYDLNYYSERLLLLTENKDILHRFFEASISRSKDFDIQIIAERWKDLFHSLIANKKEKA